MNRTPFKTPPKRPLPSPARASSARSATDPSRSRQLKFLVWTYFVLLLIEGSLRKWFLPSLAAPLLIVRDPLVLLIYASAAVAGVFPRSAFLVALTGIGFAASLLGLIQLAIGVITLPVLVFGLRTYFLHLPLIFLLPRIFNYEDVRRLGKWILILAVPMAVLMVIQFNSPASARINAAIGDGQQITSALGRIRPAGTFSFVTGAVELWALTFAVFLLGIASTRTYPTWLLVGSGFSLVSALAVSGSRSAVLSSAIVFGSFLVALGLTGRFRAGLVKLLVIGVVIVLLGSNSEYLREGWRVFSTRWVDAAATEGQGTGWIWRFLGDILGPLTQLFDFPLLGYGIGRGTNVGATLLTGTPTFLLAESEWGRVLGEAGPVVGLAYMLFRTAVTLWLGVRSVRCARQGNPLPLQLFAACALNLFTGQWGPPTTLGFAVFVAGLCHAAMNWPQARMQPRAAAPTGPQRPVRRTVRRPLPKPALAVEMTMVDPPA